MRQTIILSNDAQVGLFYVASCNVCGGLGLKKRFQTKEERDQWAGEHQLAKQHYITVTTEIRIFSP